MARWPNLRMRWQFTLGRMFVSMALLCVALATFSSGDAGIAWWVLPFSGAAVGVFAGWENAVLGAILFTLAIPLLIIVLMLLIGIVTELFT